MTRKWWHLNNEKPKSPEWHPVDLACPCCKSNVLGDVSKRIVIIRYEAQCENCGTHIAAERKRPLPNGDDLQNDKWGAFGDYDNIPF